MSGPSVTLADVVSSDVVFASPQDTLREALDVMVENRVSALPVMDARRRCIGIISVTDLMGITKELSDELSALSHVVGLDHEALVEKLEHADLLTDQVSGWMSADAESALNACAPLRGSRPGAIG